MNSHRRRRAAIGAAAMLAGVAVLGCARRDQVAPPISLVDRFKEAAVENAVAPAPPDGGVEWRFDGGGSLAPAADDPARATGGWRALHGLRGLAVRDGRLHATTDATPILVASAPATLDRSDSLQAIEIRLRASAGKRLGVSFSPGAELDEASIVKQSEINGFADLNVDLKPGPDLVTYTLTAADSSFLPSFPNSSIGHVLLRPTDAAGAEIEIESIKLLGRRAHLASLPSGIGWHGLGDVYRETLVSRAPERIAFALDVPSRSFLDLAIGTLDDGPVEFQVSLESDGQPPRELMTRTVTTPRRWESVRVDLGAGAGRRGKLVLALAAPDRGALGVWGSPTVRQSGSTPPLAHPSPARAALGGGKQARAPQGVVVVMIDTLRRDHLEAWGAKRPTAPVLADLAAHGALFRDDISQGAWTKVAVSSILTSLYPSTHGVVDMPDRISASVTTLAEAFRHAGYATFATSSVPFTGKLTNLHQGDELLYESGSIGGDSAGGAAAGAGSNLESKTARPFVDRLLPWLDTHRDVPFFVFLHVLDPHSPFEPAPPYDRLWMDADTEARHREDMKKVTAQIDYPFFSFQGLPKRAELERSGVDGAAYLEHEQAWYDASIRAMDTEIGRVLERLRELGLADSTAIAVIADHGEEFLEHGRSFHGYSAYGEMLNVPLMLWWPGVVPAATVEDTVESIDLYPTLLDLAGIEPPKEAQGQSLLPLLSGAQAHQLGWRARPAFAERMKAPAAFADDPDGVSQIAMVADGWKLIRNVEHPAGRAELELYDHRADPLNLHDVAAEHADIVQRMAAQLDAWHQAALAARIASETGDLAPEELERLRSLGYVH